MGNYNTLNSAGVNVFLNTTTNQQVTLNLTDHDSMTIDSQGNLVLDSQGDAELIFLHNPGTAQQIVTRLPLGTQVDDTIWIPSSEGR